LDDQYDAFVEKVSAALADVKVGEPEDGEALVGPLSSQAAADNLRTQVGAAVADGAQVLAGDVADSGDTRVAPALLGGITETMAAYGQELFGPIGQVYRAKDVDDAVRIANATPYGLGSRIWADDLEVARSVAARLDVGMVSINGANGEDYDMPFGGVKRSGFGRELGPRGMEEFMNRKLVVEP
ncbi:MAG TPA: aldehyde dehydrogenase family protein, partial [Candidatus Agrococcus pullicola]|nr:aldehyde dehydrogenase family protein [Candidatus Agrococcus pullicola]